MNRLKVALFILILSTFFNFAQAAVIVYPKTENSTVNSNVTFFVGSENPKYSLKINSEPVEIHSSGGFFHPVKLLPGKNIFNIDNGVDKKLIYTIYKPDDNIAEENEHILTYDHNMIYITSKDGVPLRAVPYDGGINRLQHFNKGVPLNVVGEYKQFYKVQLARDDYAWINKNYVQQISNYEYSPAKIVNFTYEETAKKKIYKFKLSQRVPYILSERTSYDYVDKTFVLKADGLDLVIYNVYGMPENKYEIYINTQDELFGYKSYFSEDNELVIEVKNSPKIDKSMPLKGLRITIDPGHGGDESGAVGCLGDYEKNINLDIALKLKDYLDKAGAKVFMTRSDDSYVSLADRVKISQNNQSDIFISIHNNALKDSDANSKRSGSSVYYFYPESKKLAEALLGSLTGKLSMKNDQLRQRSFAVIRNTESISVLLEIGYMIKPEDNAKLMKSEFQNEAALAILHGLENYLNEL